MKIAVVYHDGMLDGHFGHAEQFKLYETDDQSILSSSLLETEGSGHHYMSELMKNNGVQAVISTSMGSHARDALDELGIDSYVGYSGDADDIVMKLLRGELERGEASQCCHDEHHESEVPPIIYEGKNAGKTVKTHYRGTFNDGTQFDSSYDRGEPLEFICGTGMMIPGFDKAVVNMDLGDQVDIHLMPAEAYGERDPEAVFTMQIAQVPGSENLSVGQTVYLSNQMGMPFPVTVLEKDEKNITFDANHEMAGKELNFHIELVEIS